MGGRGVAHGVVHEVAQHFFEQHGVAVAQQAFVARLGAFVAEVDVAFKRGGHGVLHDFARELREVHGLVRHDAQPAFGAREREELLHGVGGARAGVADLFK